MTVLLYWLVFGLTTGMSGPVMKYPSMQQVADAAGLSKSAVSLALRNDPRIPGVTQERVKRIAEEMGYHRNPLVDTLMAQLRSARKPEFQANLGLVNCAPQKDLGSNHTFRRLREGVIDRAQQLGYGVEEFWLHQPGLRPKRLRQIVDARGIHGLIQVASLEHPTGGAEYADFWFHFTCSVIGVPHFHQDLHCASNDQFQTSRRAAQKALDLGYRRPALFIPPEDDALLDDKFSAGFMSATYGTEGVEFVPPQALHLDRLEAATDAIQELGPDVVISNKTELYGALVASGVSLPREMGFIHLDWHDSIPHIAGMRQNNRMVGRAGVDLVVSQLHKNETGAQEYPQLVEIESVWVDGPSVKKLRRRRAG